MPPRGPGGAQLSRQNTPNANSRQKALRGKPLRQTDPSHAQQAAGTSSSSLATPLLIDPGMNIARQTR